MFAFFSLGVTEMAVLGGCLVFVVASAAVLAVVLAVTLRRKRPVEPHDAAPPDRAREAVEALTPEEREALLRRTLEPPPRRRRPGGGEGFAP